jgi:hypothetical protein
MTIRKHLKNRTMGGHDQSARQAPFQGLGRREMATIRSKVLSLTPLEYGILPSEEFPRLYGVLLDFWERDQPATMVCDFTGFSSYCTPSNYRILGGPQDDAARTLAKQLVSASDAAFKVSIPAPAPAELRSTEARLHLLCFEGQRFLCVPIDDFRMAHGPWSGIWMRIHCVLREFEEHLMADGCRATT